MDYALSYNINRMARLGVGGLGSDLSPLQAATIAAWDMQESSGPLLPAKGGIEIPAFNSPGTTTGPAAGISARECLANSSQKFEASSSAIREVADIRGGKTVATWWNTNNAVANGATRTQLGVGSANLTDTGSQWSFRTAGREIEFRIRQADGTVRLASTATSLISDNTWYFIALSYDGTSELKGRVWDGSSLTTVTATLTDAPNAPGASAAFDLVVGGIGSILRATLYNIYEGVLTDAQLADIYGPPKLYVDL